MHEKTSPRSDLMWKPTGRIFKSVGHRWIPTRKLFDSCTSKANSEPTHGSNVDISKIHECKQTLDLSAGTSINVQKEQSIDLSAMDSKRIRRMTFEHNGSSLTPQCQKSSYNRYDKHDVDDRVGKSIRFFIRRIFQWSKSSCFKVFAVTTADASDKRQQQPDLTSSTSTLATTVTADEKFDVMSDGGSLRNCGANVKMRDGGLGSEQSRGDELENVSFLSWFGLRVEIDQLRSRDGRSGIDARGFEVGEGGGLMLDLLKAADEEVSHWDLPYDRIRVLLTLLLGSKYLFKYCCAGWIKISVEFHRYVFLSYLLAGGNLFVLYGDEDLQNLGMCDFS
ncbi:hypothetical protein Tco_0441411 [Tanacetum coccineum]